MHAGHDGVAPPAAAAENPAGSISIDVGNTVAPLVDAAGTTTWAADVHFIGGKVARGKFAVAGTDDDRLFATRRQGKVFTYAIPIADGAYTLDLLFTDTVKKSGKRQFHVDAEGQRLETGLDISARVGRRAALAVRHTVTVSGGVLDLAFIGVKGKASLSAFSLVPAGVGQPTSTPLAPAAPSNLRTTGQSASTIELAWADSSNDETVFELERSGDGGATFVLLVTLAADATTHVDVNGLEPGTVYQYRVRAVNGIGPSAWSNVLTAATTTNGTPPPTVPPPTVPPPAVPLAPRPPASLSAAAVGSREVRLSWADESDNEINFVLERSAGGGAFAGLVTLSAGAMQHRDLTVSPGVAYAYRVRATNAAGSSPYSNTATTRTPESPRWETGTPAPVALGEVAGGIIGDRLYLVGEGSSQTLAYDISTGAWTSGLATRPHVGEHHAAEVVNGKLYLFGGFNGGSSGTVQVYDPAANRWTLGAPMPFSTGSASSALIGGKVYVAGGIVNFRPNVGGQTTNQAAVYEPATNTWAPIASMPRGANHTAAGTDGQKLYVFGGRDGAGGVLNGFNTVQVYDPATNGWRSSDNAASGLAPLPRGRGGMGKAVFADGEFYVMGGETQNGSGATPDKVYDRVDVYNPSTNAWRQAAPMPTARHGIFPLLHADRIYVATGGTKAGASTSSALEILNLL